MLELESIQNATHTQQADKASHNGISDQPGQAATIKIANNDAAVAVIANPLHAQTAEAQGGDLNADVMFSQHQSMKSTLAGVREKLAKSGQLTEEIASGSFLAKSITWDMGTQTKDISSAIEDSGHSVYSDPSKSLVNLRDAIEAINSFDGFLLGVHEKIEKFKTQAEFELEQILDIEQSIAKQNSTLEIGKYSLVRIHQEQMEALRSYGSVDSERVLHLLNNDLASPSTAQQVTTQIAAPPEQHVSMQNSEQG